MKLKLIEKLGDGAFADVWKARDELDRDLAVKIIRPANVGVADALAHAKALARASHQNVVAVISLEKIPDPDTGERVDCVVMELLKGATLAKKLKGITLDVDQVKSIGLGIIRGLSHIHAQGLAHGDLHEENVMIVDDQAKVIDILYLSSLASISTETKKARLKRDLLSLRLLLQQIIIESELDSEEATEFNNLLDANASIGDIEAAFLKIVSPANSQSQARVLRHAFARLIDQDFVEGEDYAEALAETVEPSVRLPLLKLLATEKAYESKHAHYVQLLYSKLSAAAKKDFLTTLSEVIDAETPKGKWWPGLRLLSLLGTEAWNGLTPLVRLRVESLIVKDVLAGHKDIHSAVSASGGKLGTYALSLWRHFKKPEILADNLVSLLRQNWYTQNYVGSFFFRQIPAIARATKKRAEFIKAIQVAISNDARLIVKKLDELPDDWVAEIQADED